MAMLSSDGESWLGSGRGSTRGAIEVPDGDRVAGSRADTLTGGSEPGDGVDETAAMTAAACLFHGLADPSRLAILRHLSMGEHRVVDLTAHLGLAQSTVSKHLACLRDCGLVTSRPQGRASVFSLQHGDAVLALLASAEALLSRTGDAVILCPSSGLESGQ